VAALTGGDVPGPDLDFWEKRFTAGTTPWDRGAPGPQLLRWLDDGTIGPGLRVAVPGCGSGHDVALLARAGRLATGIDYAPAALALARQRLASEGLHAELVQADVTSWQPAAPFDLIYEQTCWCALHPDRWSAYAAQLHRWIRPGGQLLLMLMQYLRPSASEGRVEGPPYHVDIHAARALLAEPLWAWPAPPYPRVEHPLGWGEFAIVLQRR
jgi:methyl halide transferase